MKVEYIHQKKRDFYSIERPKDIQNFLSRFLLNSKEMHLKTAGDKDEKALMKYVEGAKISIECAGSVCEKDELIFYHIDERYIEVQCVLLEKANNIGTLVVELVRVASKTRAEQRLSVDCKESFAKEIVFPELEFTTQNINQYFHYLKETLSVFDEELKESFQNYQLISIEDFIRRPECNSIISSRKSVYIEDIDNIPSRFNDHYCDLHRFFGSRFDSYIESLKSEKVKSLIIIPLISVCQDSSRHIIGYLETKSTDNLFTKIKYQEFFDICQIVVESLQNKFYKRIKSPQYFLDISSRGFKLEVSNEELINMLSLKPENFGVEIEIEPFLSIFVYVQFIRLIKKEDQYEASFEILSSPDRHGLTNWLKYIDGIKNESV